MVKVSTTTTVAVARAAATVTERALGNQSVRQGIVDATAPHLLSTLARVNRAFDEDTHLPRV